MVRPDSPDQLGMIHERVTVALVILRVVRRVVDQVVPTALAFINRILIVPFEQRGQIPHVILARAVVRMTAYEGQFSVPGVVVEHGPCGISSMSSSLVCIPETQASTVGLVSTRAVDDRIARTQAEQVTVAVAAGHAAARPHVLAVPRGPAVPRLRNRVTRVD